MTDNIKQDVTSRLHAVIFTPKDKRASEGPPSRRSDKGPARSRDQLIAEFGPAGSETRSGGATILTWQLGRGDGIILCRSARSDPDGLALASQARQLLDMAGRHGLATRYLLAADGVPGSKKSARPDIELVLRLLESEPLSWLAVRDLTRIGRDDVFVYSFARRLAERKIKIYVADGRLLNRMAELLLD